MNIWILIIMLTAKEDTRGGMAIAHIEFHSQAACESAKEQAAQAYLVFKTHETAAIAMTCVQDAQK